MGEKGIDSLWEKLLHVIHEANESLLVNEVTFWVLAGLYGIIALGALCVYVCICVCMCVSV